MTNISIFASGTGSNALNLIHHFAQHPSISINAVFCNRADAPVIEKTQAAGIETILFNKTEFLDPHFAQLLHNRDTHWIVLAGFLWLFPQHLVDLWPGKIINIHPALLPKYGGKGMFGHHVHESVIADRQSKSGITIHRVDNLFDHGETLFQVTCSIKPDDTPEDLAASIHLLEQRWFPIVVQTLIEKGPLGVKEISGNETL